MLGTPTVEAWGTWERSPSLPGRIQLVDLAHRAGTRAVLLGALLRDPREQGTDLGLPVAPVTA